MASPPGFVKSTIPLDAPPVGLAFDADGVLWALEGAPSGSNLATMRAILPDGTFGTSFSVCGDDAPTCQTNSTNFFVGSMAYDPLGDQLLISDNTADGRLYAVDKLGNKQSLVTGVAGIAGVAVRESGEIFVSAAPFGSEGQVLQIDRTNGAKTPVMGGLGFGAGLSFDLVGDLIVQDANTTTFLGRLQRLPISETPDGLSFGAPLTLLSNMQSSAGVIIDSENDIFTTGSGGLFQVAGAPLTESTFDNNGNQFQFATAAAFDAGSQPFEGFSGPNGGRLAYMADFGFGQQDSFVTTLTPARPGDYNTDGDVDEEDYALWRGTFGSTDDLSADGSGNQLIDAADYVIWRKHAQPAGENSFAARGGPTVPEPATLPLTSAIAVAAALNWLRVWRSIAPTAELVPMRARGRS